MCVCIREFSDLMSRDPSCSGVGDCSGHGTCVDVNVCECVGRNFH